MQQRGICVEALADLLEFGTAVPARGGAEIVFFDKSGASVFDAPGACADEITSINCTR
jgi:hypothetical protein